MGIELPSDQEAGGRTLGGEEIAAVSEVIKSGTLTVTKGRFGKEFEERFRLVLGVERAVACSSGTAAIHAAVAAINPEPGDEIVTTAITDMGALSPIIYQTAIPVFADVDPLTCNITAETIQSKLSERTKAIIVTHLFGLPCEMEPIMKLARQRNIPVIEDCAQAFLAEYDGHYVGTIGDIGCFSLQQGKHITCGEGGVVVTNNAEFARHMYLFVNKAWGYGDAHPDHYFLAPNYRPSELQMAVADAQLSKLVDGVTVRAENADYLTSLLHGLPGIRPLEVSSRGQGVYWRYSLLVDPGIVKGGNIALAAALRAQGIFTAPRYIQKPAFMCEVFAKRRTFGNSGFPFNLARPEAVDYREELYPGVSEGLGRILVMPWNEKFTRSHIEQIAESVRTSLKELCK